MQLRADFRKQSILQLKDGKWVLNRDIYFEHYYQAACFVEGRMREGHDAWVGENGEYLQP